MAGTATLYLGQDALGDGQIGFGSNLDVRAALATFSNTMSLTAVGSLNASAVAIAFGATMGLTGIGTLAVSGSITWGDAADLTEATLPNSLEISASMLTWSDTMGLTGIGSLESSEVMFASYSNAVLTGIGSLAITGSITWGDTAGLTAIGTLQSSGSIVIQSVSTLDPPPVPPTAVTRHRLERRSLRRMR